MGNKDIVNKLKKDHPRNEQCSEMFRLWLQQKKPLPSWERLISILKSKEIGMTEVAEKILKQYDGMGYNYICTYVATVHKFYQLFSYL